MTDKQYTVKQAIEKTGLSKRRILNAIQRRELAASRLRDTHPWTISERALSNFLEKEKEGSLRAV